MRRENSGNLCVQIKPLRGRNGRNSQCDNDQDLSVPLEVTFTGECAEDYGGPRRELLTLMIREIHERLFVKSGEGSSCYTLTDNTVHADKKCYFGAGLIFGKTFTCS